MWRNGILYGLSDRFASVWEYPLRLENMSAKVIWKSQYIKDDFTCFRSKLSF